jgi:hypothetical protein
LTTTTTEFRPGTAAADGAALTNRPHSDLV